MDDYWMRRQNLSNCDKNRKDWKNVRTSIVFNDYENLEQNSY
jgi:hypothetical protein